MNLDQAVIKACKEESLVDALTWIAIWETERVVQQAKKYFETGVSTASHNGGWDTCFKICFEKVLNTYKNKHLSKKKGQP
jgi:recombinational DNA repair protein RecT